MTPSAPQQYDRRRLFLIGVLALFTAALSASLRAAVANDIRLSFLEPVDTLRSAALVGQALGVSFLGFAATLFLASPLVDAIGMKRLLVGAASAFVGGTLLVVFAGSLADGMGVFWVIWAGMLLCGVGWGCVEAAINPMTTSLYPEDKTHRLNVLHAWWPAGLIVGGLVGVGMARLGLDWQLALSLVIVSAVVFGFLCLGTEFPQTERRRAGISFGDMLQETLRRPSFLIWFGAMFLTAASELAPGQWVDLALTHTVGMRGILLLVYVSGMMFVLRHFAGPLAHRLSDVGLLWVSGGLASLGLFMLSAADSPVTALVAATVWGAGVCFMWPTMLAAVAERYPRGGSWMIGLMGSAGALSIYFVLPRMGALFDRVKIEQAGGAEAFAKLSGTGLEDVLAIAARESFRAVAYVPLVLLVVFGVIWLVERRGRRVGTGAVAEDARG
jgi:predicted MFS family arabinose efflux permease